MTIPANPAKPKKCRIKQPYGRDCINRIPKRIPCFYPRCDTNTYLYLILRKVTHEMSIYFSCHLCFCGQLSMIRFGVLFDISLFLLQVTLKSSLKPTSEIESSTPGRLANHGMSRKWMGWTWYPCPTVPRWNHTTCDS